MHDALAVRRVEGVGDLNADVDEQMDLEGAALEALAQRLALDQLHRDEVLDVNLLFKLDERGLRDKVTPLVGLEYAF